jgi:hypothetical protein
MQQVSKQQPGWPTTNNPDLCTNSWHVFDRLRRRAD